MIVFWFIVVLTIGVLGGLILAHDFKEKPHYVVIVCCDSARKYYVFHSKDETILFCNDQPKDTYDVEAWDIQTNEVIHYT